MNVTDLKARLKEGKPASFYIICGEEEYLKRHYRGEIKNACTDSDSPFAFFNHQVFDGEEFSVSEFAEAIKSPPMMEEYKLIEWQHANLDSLKEAEINELIALAEAKEDYPYATVIISALDTGFDTGTQKRPSKLYSRLLAAFDILIFDRSTDAQLISWLARHFAAEGIQADQSVLNLLLMRVGHSMQSLYNEVEKLCIYAAAHGNKTVSANDVNEICSSSIESDAFAISNAIIEKNTEKAFLALMDMKQERVDAGAALAQLARTYADLMSIALLAEEGKGTADIAAIMKFHPYKLGLYLTCAKKLGKEKISGALSRLIKTDALSKSGGISGFEAVEIFISQSIGK